MSKRFINIYAALVVMILINIGFGQIAYGAPTGSIDRDNYQDMPLFIKYANSKLSSCTKCAYSPSEPTESCIRCQFSADDQNRLGFILSLYAYGSNAPEAKVDSETYITNMPGAESTSRYKSGTSGGQYVSKCSLYNNVYIDSILTLKSTESTSQTACYRSETVAQGVKNLIKLCEDGHFDCDRFLDSTSGFLGTQLNQPRELETMYWNMVDNNISASQGVVYNWKTLSPEDYKVIKYIINNPDNAPRKPVTGNTSKRKDDQVCDPQGGLGQLIICPGVSLIEGGFDDSFSSLSDRMVLAISLFDSSSDSGASIKDAWTIMRDITNVLLAIVLIVMVFSQITGYGISNYGVKQLLPKFFVALILANLSYYVLIVLFDISNIIGSGIYGLFKSAGDISAEARQVLAADSIGEIISTVLTKVFDLILFVIVGLLSIVILVVQNFAIDLRFALAIVLIVFAPIAAVLFVLPNTQKITKAWWQGIWIVITIFPILALVYGSGYLSYKISLGTGGSGDLFLTDLMSRMALVLPMILSPIIIINLVKSAPTIGTSFGKLTGMLNKKLGFKAAQQKITSGDTYKRYQETVAKNNDLVATGNYKGINPIKRLKSKAYGAGLANLPIFADQTQRAASNSQKNILQKASGMTLATANSLIEDAHTQVPGQSNPKYTQLDLKSSLLSDERHPKPTFSSQSARNEYISSVTDTGKVDALLAATVSLAINGAQQHNTDPQAILKGLQAAKKHGASQLQLSQTYSLAMKQLTEAKDANGIGELKANTEYYRQQSNKNPKKFQNFGEYDESLYTDSGSNSQAYNEFSKIRHDMVKQEMLSQIIEKPNSTEIPNKNNQDNQGSKQEIFTGNPKIVPQKVIFSQEAIAENSMGAKVFKELWDNQNDTHFRESIIYSAKSMSGETIKQINNITEVDISSLPTTRK